MAVVKLNYIRSKQEIKAHLRYIAHRRGREHEKITRDLFNKWGLTDKDALYRRFDSAGRGTVFYKFMISPDPGKEDALKDLDLQQTTRRTIARLEKAIGRRLPFVAAVHNDHTDKRHVHGILLSMAAFPGRPSALCKNPYTQSQQETLPCKEKRVTYFCKIPATNSSTRVSGLPGVGEAEPLRFSLAATPADTESFQAFPPLKRTAQCATHASGRRKSRA
jgi:hypothetical protein